MRPIKLEMQAFGSYLEKTVIDFEKLGKDALFLINGATGSGKTMLIDAMVYALYGDKRFSKQGGNFADMRHSLAKDEDKTYVKFTFDIGGTKYRAERSMTVNKSDSRKATNSFTLFDETANKEITVDASKKLEEKLGFNAQQFKQVILLPQGKFRELLVTTPKDRKDMLKEIFKTGIYEQISIALKTEADKLEKDRNDLEIRKSELLANEESAEKISEKISEAARKLENFEEEKALLAKKRDESKKEYDTAVQLKKNIEDLTKVQQEQQEKERLAPTIAKERDLLDKGDKADAVKGYYNKRNDYTRKSAELKETVKRQTKELEAKEEKLHSAAQRNEKARQLEEKAKEYRAQETKLQQAKERLEKLAEEVKKLRKQYREAEANYGSAEADVKKYTEAVALGETRNQELEKEKHDAELAAANENALKLSIENMKKQQEIFGEIDKLTEKLKQLEENKQKQEVDLEACEAAVKKLGNDLETARELFQHGQAGFLAKSLTEGKPCPVCGSIHHPTPAELSDTIPDKKEIEKKQKALEKSENEYNTKKLQLNNLAKDMESTTNSLTEKKAQLPEGCSEDQLRNDLRTAQKEYNAAQEASKKIAALDDNIKAGKEALLENQNKLKEAQENFDKLQQELVQIKSLRDDKAKELPEGEEALEKLAEEIRQCKDKYTNLEREINDAREAFEKAGTEVAETKAALAANKEQDAQLDGDLAKAIKECETEMQKNGFADEAAYLAIMENELVNTPEAREKMKAAHEEYNEARIKLDERAAALKDAIGEEKMPDVESLKSKSDEAEAKLQESISMAGAAQKTLSDLKDKAYRLQEIEAKLQAIYKDYEVAGTLSDVAIGKMSGGKLSFQKYVLSSLMYNVLNKANRRLMVMSRNQYELRQPLNGDALAMEVFDNYTGSSRPVESLSGGESFLASLALALGLADEIQSFFGNIRMDAMFIDEGFGTLDPETLDIAMKALLKLRASGRMIGIISHVEDLKERIDRRIDVVKDPEKGSRVKLVC